MKVILSLCGGGIRGVYVARLLMHIDNELKKRGTSLYESVDLFAGTSIGSLIMAEYVYEKRSGDYIDNLFNLEMAEKLMHKTLKDRLFGYFQISPMYNGKYKREFINTEFQNIPISQCNKLVLFTSYNVSTRKPILFKSWNDNTGIYLRDALDMGSAAPGYFPTVVSENGVVGTDGGIFANNPCLIAYSNAIKLFKDEDIRILSIGTGKLDYNNDVKSSTNWGSIQWALNGVIDCIIDGPEDEVHNIMHTLTCAHKHQYCRINPFMKKLSIDDTSKEYMTYMKKLADSDWKFYKDKIMKIFELNQHVCPENVSL